MLARVLCWLAVVSGCDSGGDKLNFDAKAEDGSTWQLDVGAGTLTGDTPFTGTCPTFASATMHLPNTESMSIPCGATCTCIFDLVVSDQDGLFSDGEALSIDFIESCDDNSDLNAYADIEASTTNDTLAYADAPTSSNSDPYSADCVYPLHLSVTFDP